MLRNNNNKRGREEGIGGNSIPPTKMAKTVGTLDVRAQINAHLASLSELEKSFGARANTHADPVHSKAAEEQEKLREKLIREKLKRSQEYLQEENKKLQEKDEAKEMLIATLQSDKEKLQQELRSTNKQLQNVHIDYEAQQRVFVNMQDAYIEHEKEIQHWLHAYESKKAICWRQAQELAALQKIQVELQRKQNDLQRQYNELLQYIYQNTSQHHKSPMPKFRSSSMPSPSAHSMTLFYAREGCESSGMDRDFCEDNNSSFPQVGENESTNSKNLKLVDVSYQDKEIIMLPGRSGYSLIELKEAIHAKINWNKELQERFRARLEEDKIIIRLRGRSSLLEDKSLAYYKDLLLERAPVEKTVFHEISFYRIHDKQMVIVTSVKYGSLQLYSALSYQIKKSQLNRANYILKRKKESLKIEFKTGRICERLIKCLKDLGCRDLEAPISLETQQPSEALRVDAGRFDQFLENTFSMFERLGNNGGSQIHQEPIDMHPVAGSSCLK